MCTRVSHPSCFTISPPLFQLLGDMPSPFTLLNNLVSSFVLSFKSVFKSSATTLSCPAAFSLLVDFMAFSTSDCRNTTASNSLYFYFVSISCSCIGLTRGSLLSTVLLSTVFPDLQSFALLVCQSSVCIVYRCTCSSLLTCPSHYYSVQLTCSSVFCYSLSIAYHLVHQMPLVFTGTLKYRTREYFLTVRTICNRLRIQI